MSQHCGDLDLPQGSIKWNLWDALKTHQEEEVQVGWFRKPKPQGDSQRLEERLSDAVNLSFFFFFDLELVWMAVVIPSSSVLKFRVSQHQAVRSVMSTSCTCSLPWRFQNS